MARPHRAPLLAPERRRVVLVHLGLLLAPMPVAILLAQVPLVGPDVYDFAGFTRTVPWEGILTTASQAKWYRPLGALQSKVFDTLWGTSPPPYYLTAGGLLGFLALLTYRFHISLAPVKKRTAYGASLLFALSTPALYAMAKGMDAEIAAGISLYVILLGMQRLGEGRGPGTHRLWLLLTVASMFGGFSKETFLGILPPILGTYVFWRWRQHTLKREQAMGLACVISGYLIAFGLHFGLAPAAFSSSGQAFQFPSPNFLVFAYHNFTQFSYPLLFAGAAAIFLAALPRGRKIAGPLLLGLLLTAPPLIATTFHETIRFTVESQPHHLLFGILLLAGLGIQLARWDLTMEWYYSGTVLAVFAAMVILLSLAGSERFMTSTRNYIMVLPFSFWLLVDSLARLRATPPAASTPTQGEALAKVPGRVTRGVAVVLTAMVLYHAAAGAVNLTGRSMAEATALHPVRQALASQSLDDASLYQVNPWIVYVEELRGRGYTGPLPRFQSAMPDQPVSRDKTATDTYYYIEKTGPRGGWRPLRGSMPVEYLGVSAQLLFTFLYTTETPLETSTAAATRIEEKRTAFLHVAPWLEDTPVRLLRGIPWVEDYEALRGLYRVP